MNNKNIIQKRTEQLDNEIKLLKSLTEKVLTMTDQINSKDNEEYKNLIAELKKTKEQWIAAIESLNAEKARYEDLIQEIKVIKNNMTKLTTMKNENNNILKQKIINIFKGR